MNPILRESGRAQRETEDRVVPLSKYAVTPGSLEYVSQKLDDLNQQLFGAIFMVKALERRAATRNAPWAREARRLQALLGEVIRQTELLARDFHRPQLPADALERHLKKRAAKARARTRNHRLRIELPARPLPAVLPERNGRHALVAV